MKTQINWTQMHTEAVEEFQRLIPLLFGPQPRTSEEYTPIALSSAARLIESISNSPPEIQNAFIENLPLFVACAIGREGIVIPTDEHNDGEECDCDFCLEERAERTENRYYDLMMDGGLIELVPTTLDEQCADPTRFGSDESDLLEFYVERPDVWNCINTTTDIWEACVEDAGGEEEAYAKLEIEVDKAGSA